MSSSSASSGARRASRVPSSSSRASSSCLRSSRVRRRSRSMARCLAACISQAPGLRGTPDAGHCSRAATSASCARSSAAPRSRTRRISPAISFGASRRHTASMAAWESAAHAVGPDPAAGAKSSASKTLANLDVSALVRIRVRAAAHPLDHLGLRPALQDPEAGDQLLGFGERTVHHRALLAVEGDAGALRAGLQPVAGQHHARLDELLVERPHLRQLLRGRHHARFRFLRGLDDHHETHLNLLRGSRRSARCGPAVLSTRRTGRAGIDTDPESTNQEHVVTFMLIRKADRQTEAYNGGSGQ